MSRQVVAFEGIATKDGRFIEHGALEWRPVVQVSVRTRSRLRNLVSHESLGYATEFERLADGRITANIHPAIIGLSPQIEIDMVELLDTYPLRVTHGRISLIILSNTPAWDGMVIL